MAATVWGKFYWSDWRGDPALRACGLAARGLWMEMLCIEASHDPVGYVSLNGRPVGTPDLARMTGATEAEVSGLLAELELNGVFSRDRRGRIHSRRMVRDAKRSEEGRKHGRLGGNPSLRGRKGNPAALNSPLTKCRRLTSGTKCCGFQELSIAICSSADHDGRFCQRAAIPAQIGAGHHRPHPLASPDKAA